jgi:GST-like protein
LKPGERFLGETKRLLGVLDKRLERGPWIMGDTCTVADLAMFGRVRALIEFYGARELVRFDDLHNVSGWLDGVLARPAAQRGLHIRG